MGLDSLPVLFVPEIHHLSIGFYFGATGFLMATLSLAWSLDTIRPLPRFLALFVGASVLVIVQFIGAVGYDFSVLLLYLMVVFAVGACIEAQRNNVTGAVYRAIGKAVLATVLYYVFLLSAVCSLSV